METIMDELRESIEANKERGVMVEVNAPNIHFLDSITLDNIEITANSIYLESDVAVWSIKDIQNVSAINMACEKGYLVYAGNTEITLILV